MILKYASFLSLSHSRATPYAWSEEVIKVPLHVGMTRVTATNTVAMHGASIWLRTRHANIYTCYAMSFAQLLQICTHSQYCIFIIYIICGLEDELIVFRRHSIMCYRHAYKFPME